MFVLFKPRLLAGATRITGATWLAASNGPPSFSVRCRFT